MGGALDKRPSAAPRQPGGVSAQQAIQPGHQDALDWVRGLASIGVVTYHVAGTTGLVFQDTLSGRLFSHGQIRVPIFFALSGLLLYRSWARATLLDGPPADTRRYFVRRALRILPAYWLVVFVALISFHQEHIDSQWTWTRFLFFLQNYDAHPWWNLPGPRGMGQLWSLVVEASFYLLLPVIGITLGWLVRRGRTGGQVEVRTKRLLLIFAALIAASFAYTAWIFTPGHHLVMELWLPRSLCWFALGMAICAIGVAAGASDGWPRRVHQVLGNRWWWLAAAGAYFLTTTDVVGDSVLSLTRPVRDTLIENALFLITVALILAPAAYLPARRREFGDTPINRVLVFLAKISYGTFLWQFIVIDGYYAITGRPMLAGDFWTVLGWTLPPTLVLATISYYVIERPALRLRFLFDRPPAPGKPAAESPRS
jgi:peptidoglycan/LPS O-acetylase OafA/YrhL